MTDGSNVYYCDPGTDCNCLRFCGDWKEGSDNGFLDEPNGWSPLNGPPFDAAKCAELDFIRRGGTTDVGSNVCGDSIPVFHGFVLNSNYIRVWGFATQKMDADALEALLDFKYLLEV